MEKMEIFRSDEFGELGVMIIDGKEYFPATQCAKLLGYADPFKAIKQHCDEEGWVNRPVLTNGGYQNVKFINEGNLYRLIIRSKLPAAKKFERWVFDEVLPEIRRTGGYGGVNVEEVITKAVTTAVSETIKAIAPMFERPSPDIIYDAYESDRRRRGNCSIISKLETSLRTEIDDMILSQKYSYEEVKDFLAEQGVSCSISSVQRYAKRLYRR